ncbi:MAG: hypothetical protein PUP93_27390 [Rhizonema sp. NSF051]|nr:hypothetical protein [Rhizonema sp. NSF051]
MVLVNPRDIEKAIESRLESGGLNARIRTDPSETNSRPVNKYFVWVRYYESPEYPQTASPDYYGVSQQRLMVFHVLTDVADLVNHEKALLIHNSAIALLTNFFPPVAGVKTPLVIKRDKFEKSGEGRWQYRADFEILTEHISELPTDFVLPEEIKVGVFNNAIGKRGDTTDKDAEVDIQIPRTVRIVPKAN